MQLNSLMFANWTRFNYIAEFRESRVPILIATDVAARGLGKLLHGEALYFNTSSASFVEKDIDHLVKVMLIFSTFAINLDNICIVFLREKALLFTHIFLLQIEIWWMKLWLLVWFSEVNCFSLVLVPCREVAWRLAWLSRDALSITWRVSARRGHVPAWSTACRWWHRLSPTRW